MICVGALLTTTSLSRRRHSMTRIFGLKTSRSSLLSGVLAMSRVPPRLTISVPRPNAMLTAIQARVLSTRRLRVGLGSVLTLESTNTGVASGGRATPSSALWTSAASVMSARVWKHNQLKRQPSAPRAEVLTRILMDVSSFPPSKV